MNTNAATSVKNTNASSSVKREEKQSNDNKGTVTLPSKKEDQMKMNHQQTWDQDEVLASKLNAKR